MASSLFFFFFFNDTATTEIYTLSLHDALPIYQDGRHLHRRVPDPPIRSVRLRPHRRHRGPQVHVPHYAERHGAGDGRSEEHTSELQSQSNLVCRLLLEKKKKNKDSKWSNRCDD